MRTCTVCSWSLRARSSVDRCLLNGMTYSHVAKKFARPNRPISRSAIMRHARHVLTLSPEGHRPRGGAPMVIPPGKSAVEQAQTLIEWHNQMAEDAKASGQFIAAIAAKREVRAAIELQCKLSGELASANVNFYAMTWDEKRVADMLEAASLQGPAIAEYVKQEVAKRFQPAVPSLTINFVKPPERNGGTTLKLLDVSAAAPNQPASESVIKLS
jgi:hypothetical protein